MLKIIGNNSTGKTKKLIDYVSTNGGVIVCKHPIAMVEKAYAYGYYNVKCISYDDYLHDFKTITEEKYVDDLDSFMEAMNCNGYTLSTD